MAEQTYDKRRLISDLIKSPHSKLAEYVDVGLPAAERDAEFFAQLLAWNHVKGQIRDAKVAFPILALKALYGPIYRTNVITADGPLRDRYAENALAHLADLRPREFVKAINFGWDIGAPTRMLDRLMIRYVRDLEADRHDWERTAIIHREMLRWLYSQTQIPVKVAMGESALFGQIRKGKDRGPAPQRFRVLATLKDLSPVEIAGQVEKYKLPFLIVRGALGAKAKDPDVVLALMKRMSSTELVTNMKWLERVGVKTVPALRAQLEESLGKAASSKKAPKATLKTTRAAEALADEPALSGKLRVLQEKQLDKLAGIDGNWLVLADKSGSMEQAMEAARLVAGTLTRLVKGRVHLVFFDTTPRYLEATGKTYEELQQITAGYTAAGGTSIGCGVQALADRDLAVDGIAIVSDGCENQFGYPHFSDAYTSYVRRLGMADQPPTVYWYRTAVTVLSASIEAVMRDHRMSRGDALLALRDSAVQEITGFQTRCLAAKIDVQIFDLSVGEVDYYSVVNLVPTMKVARYQLLDEIQAMPLRTLDEVLDRTLGVQVLPQRVGQSARV